MQCENFKTIDNTTLRKEDYENEMHTTGNKTSFNSTITLV